MTLVVLAVSLSWWLAPPPQVPSSIQRQSDPWLLPAAPQGRPEESVATIVAANLWGAVAQGTEEMPLNSPEWHFSGITVNGREKFVMITVEGQSMQSLKAGDQLPGGARILKIYDNYLCLLIKGKKRKLDIFQ